MPYLSTSEVMIHEEALYQGYILLPLPLPGCLTLGAFCGSQVMFVTKHGVHCRVAASVPHFKALMAMSDLSAHRRDSELTSSDDSHGDHPAAQRADHVVVNYGPAKAKCVNAACQVETA